MRLAPPWQVAVHAGGGKGPARPCHRVQSSVVRGSSGQGGRRAAPPEERRPPSRRRYGMVTSGDTPPGAGWRKNSRFSSGLPGARGSGREEARIVRRGVAGASRERRNVPWEDVGERGEQEGVHETMDDHRGARRGHHRRAPGRAHSGERGAPAQHPGDHGRRHRVVQPERVQPRDDGLPDTPHRPARPGRGPLHGLLRPAELHGGAGRVHHGPDAPAHRPHEDRACRARSSGSATRIPPSRTC